MKVPRSLPPKFNALCAPLAILNFAFPTIPNSFPRGALTLGLNLRASCGTIGLPNNFLPIFNVLLLKFSSAPINGIVAPVAKRALLRTLCSLIALALGELASFKTFMAANPIIPPSSKFLNLRTFLAINVNKA